MVFALKVLYITRRTPAGKGTRLIPKEVISAIADMTSFLSIRLVGKSRVGPGNPLP